MKSRVIFSVAVFTLFVLVGMSRAFAEQPKPVTVENLPLPIQGTVQAEIQGKVIQPVRKQVFDSFSPSIPSILVDLFTVPAEKCLIIEHVAAAALGAGQLNVNFLDIRLSGDLFPIPIDAFQTDSNNPPNHFVSKAVKIYVLPEETVQASASISPITSGGTVVFVMNGQILECGE